MPGPMSNIHFPKDYDILVRSFLVDPTGTEMDLRAAGRGDVATMMMHDYRIGRLAENYAHMTGNVVSVTKAAATMAGALIDSSAPKDSREQGV